MCYTPVSIACSLSLLRLAVAADDQITTSDPPTSLISTRHVLGYFLLQAARAELEKAKQPEAFLVRRSSKPGSMLVQASLLAGTSKSTFLQTAQGYLAEAEAVYRQDLSRRPQNLWSLVGLKQALQLAGHDSALVEQQLQEASKHADFPVSASWG